MEGVTELPIAIREKLRTSKSYGFKMKHEANKQNK